MLIQENFLPCHGRVFSAIIFLYAICLVRIVTFERTKFNNFYLFIRDLTDSFRNFVKTLFIAVRSGDYYLFEDLDEKVELELLHERPSAGIDDAITDRKMSDKMTIEQVGDWQIHNLVLAEYY